LNAALGLGHNVAIDKHSEGEEAESEDGFLLDEVKSALPDTTWKEDAEAKDITDSEESKHDDAPPYDLEVGEKCMMDPNYVFCPEAHCHQILKLFTHHLCQHPFFPTFSGSYQTKEEI